ncbi:CoA ester lyase [Virgibacillus sp. NKC19-16]|uniref:HpcH/HpaI aldolase/citrate lyase family protein n=1 Tax=Virgibacillus salidurans TaxID=2831673 RepID=UPI001F2E0ECE|nr:CoA ester lyase [Virgibacillus sp. NKC19-16]UJL47703.1 CoA ester lyase [Virgibacillus sp. NKC19-16]
MLHRSLLFVPSDKEKMLLKINELPADIIILDLEDAVAQADKESARTLIHKHFSTMEKQMVVRMNDIQSKAYAIDLKLIKEIATYGNFIGVMLPKANTDKDIQHLAKHLDEIESMVKRANPLNIFPLIETASGVKNAFEIAGASTRISALVFGGVDYVNDIDGEATEEEKELLFPRSQIVISSRAAGIQKPIDTVYIDINNQDGFQKNAKAAKKLAFGGKLLVHPKQIKIANEVFSPSDKEIKEAREILANMNEQGVFQWNGKMVDKPIIDKANRVINEFNMISTNKG